MYSCRKNFSCLLFRTFIRPLNANSYNLILLQFAEATRKRYLFDPFLFSQRKYLYSHKINQVKTQRAKNGFLENVFLNGIFPFREEIHAEQTVFMEFYVPFYGAIKSAFNFKN